MYWILFVMAALVSVVAAIVVGGLATPRKHRASRAIVLHSAPETVWSAVRNVAQYPDWRDDIQSVEMESSSESGTRWTEIGRSGSMSYQATVDEAPWRFTARITNDDLGFGGEWQYVLTPAGDGTRLVITEDGEVGNLIFRFVGAHILGHTRTIDTYLRDLAMHLNERARPEPVTR